MFLYFKLFYITMIVLFLLFIYWSSKRRLSPEDIERLINIKYLGDSRYLHLRVGSERLYIMKHFLKKDKFYNKKVNRMKTLFEKNSITVNPYDYVLTKSLITLFLTIVTALLLWVLRSETIQDTILKNTNIIVFYLFTFICLDKIDIWFLNQLYNNKVATLKSELIMFSLFIQLAVESGNNLINALRQATESSKGILNREFSIALDEYDSGCPFDIAIKSLEERLQLADLTDFFSFIRRAYAAHDFSTMIKEQRQLIQKMNFNQAKEYDKRTKDKFTLYNQLTALADMLIFFIPIAIFIMQTL